MYKRRTLYKERERETEPYLKFIWSINNAKPREIISPWGNSEKIRHNFKPLLLLQERHKLLQAASASSVCFFLVPSLSRCKTFFLAFKVIARKWHFWVVCWYYFTDSGIIKYIGTFQPWRHLLNWWRHWLISYSGITF